MANNTTLNSGSGGDTMRTLEKSSGAYKVSSSVLDKGGSGAESLISDSNPMPVTLRDSSGTEIGTNAAPVQIGDAGGSLTVDGTVAVSGTVTVGSHAVTNAGTFAVQVDGTGLTRLTDIETNTDSGAVVGNGAAATAQRVTLANDSTGIVALTTSTASIGKLAANSGVDIGDVDVTSIAAGDNNIGNVDIVTVPADPFGANADAAATAGSTGSMQAKFRLMTSQLDSIKTAVETLDNTVGGSELQVDIVGSLPAGTAAIGKLAANSGVDIGDVDVTSIAVGDNLIGRVKLSDGTTVATVRELGTNDALNVSICDGSGDQITSFGGGTQYTEADTDASITGTAVMWEDASDTLRAVSAAKPLPITAIAGTTGAVPMPIVPAIATISTTVTRPNDTTAYAANDAFANSTSAPTSGGFTLTSAARASGGYGKIIDAVITASGGTVYQGELWLFDQAVTAVNDNAALTITDSEAQTLVGVIPFITSDTNAANSISYVTGLNIGYTCVGTANLRFLVKIMQAVTPAAQEVLSVRIKVEQ